MLHSCKGVVVIGHAVPVAVAHALRQAVVGPVYVARQDLRPPVGAVHERPLRGDEDGRAVRLAPGARSFVAALLRMTGEPLRAAEGGGPYGGDGGPEQARPLRGRGDGKKGG